MESLTKSNMRPLLEINNLQVDFINELGTTTAIREISFQVNRGEVVALVGESGSGKSVTAMSILKLLAEKSARYINGEILLSEDGVQFADLLKLSKKEIRQIRGNKVGMIFQEPMTSLNPVFTCGDQVAEAIKEHKKLGSKQARLAAIDLFEKVKLPYPTEVYDRYPHQLSGGQKQRVMIALAMSCEPSLLICDEPTTALDVTVQKTILSLIKELQLSNNMGVILITHDLGIVDEIADRIVMMYKGSIVEQATVNDIFEKANHPYTRALIACRPSLHPKGERLPVVADFMTNDRDTSLVHEPMRKPQQPAIGEVLVQAKNLSVWYPRTTSLFGAAKSFTKAVDDVNIEIFQGETLGLVGESGCGKTSLGRCLLRLIDPTSGQVYYKGRDLTKIPLSELNKLRKNIQIVFQDPYSSLNPSLTIEKAIAEPLVVHTIVEGKAAIRDRVVELLEKVNLKPEHLKRYPHEFSGGQRQRIVIARALAVNPSFVVCDESVSALDVSVQAQVLNMLSDLKKELGFTVLFISHDLSVVHYLSDRIAVMKQGQIEELGTASDVFNSPKSNYTKQLMDSIPKIRSTSTLH